MPSADAFEDDDDDEELDASASNEYPDNENDNDNDENYEDADDAQDNAESRRSELWTLARPKTAAAKLGGHAIWNDLEGWRRNKRDLEDRIVLASRRAAQRRKAESATNGEDPDFVVDDGDEDAWVHDGVDDIHIDPETKKAASELNYDEKSIDSEYEPKEQIVNRTRITTIAEVIPTNLDTDNNGNTNNNGNQMQSNDQDSSKVIHHYLPASHLSMEQVQKLMATNSPAIKLDSTDNDDDDNGQHQYQRHLSGRNAVRTRVPTTDGATGGDSPESYRDDEKDF